MSNSPASDNIDETNNMITELYPELQCNDVNNIIGNPGFPSINQNILFCLDNDSQLAFKQVCRSWMEQVNQPIFLIKKLNSKSHPKKIGNVWIDLVGRIQKGSDLEKEVTDCLMVWYYQYYHNYQWFELRHELEGILPIHIASYFGYINIVKFVATYSENVNAPSKYDGFTPLQIAAQFGSTEIFKFLAPQVKNPN